MQRVRHRSISLLLVALVLTSASVAQTRIPESQLKATVTADTVLISGSVSSNVVGNATVRLSLVDPAGAVVATASQAVKLGTGESRFELSLTPNNASNLSLDSALWLRLRYSLVDENGTKSASGTVALAAICPDIFDIRVAHPAVAMEGRTYQARVHAANPVTKRPVGGVHVSGSAIFGDAPDAKKLVSSKTTNAAGDAVLTFEVPEHSDDGTLKVEAIKNGLKRQDDFDVEVHRYLKVIVSTDKRLYQPGQALHVRALVFGPTRNALGNAPFDFTLSGPGNETMFRGSAKTNKFGIASVDWTLPDNARLGDYSLSIKYSGDEDYGNDETRASVRVSRYELPQFSVSTSLDKPYYLPGQDAELKLSADYLFGKPVIAGTVRVVRETDREWNYQTQKYETTEEEKYTSKLDRDGTASFHLDLSKLHAEFTDETYHRFRDWTYAAYVTDVTCPPFLVQG